MCMCWVSDVRSSPWAFESSALTVIYLLQFCPSLARLTRDRRQSEVNFSFLCKMWKSTSTALTATMMPMTMLMKMIMTKLRWNWICHDGLTCTVKWTSKIFSNVVFFCYLFKVVKGWSMMKKTKKKEVKSRTEHMKSCHDYSRDEMRRTRDERLFKTWAKRAGRLSPFLVCFSCLSNLQRSQLKLKCMHKKVHKPVSFLRICFRQLMSSSMKHNLTKWIWINSLLFPPYQQYWHNLLNIIDDF